MEWDHFDEGWDTHKLLEARYAHDPRELAEMTSPRTGKPSIPIKALAQLLSGDAKCEWALQFQTQNVAWTKITSDFDFASWQADHDAMVDEIHDFWKGCGYTGTLEDYNAFTLEGKVASLGGRPDLIVRRGHSSALIIDAKTGKRRDADIAQVKLYMYAAPKSLPQHRGVTFEGRVRYKDGEVRIDPSEINDEFVSGMGTLIQRLASDEPVQRVPSGRECSFCSITSEDCSDRIEKGKGFTEDF